MTDFDNILTNAPNDMTEPQLLASLREGMLQNKLQIVVKEKARTKKRTLPIPDPILWDAQLQQLIAAKLDGGITVGYWRVSLDSQVTEGHGPEIQKQSIIAWVVTNTKRGEVDLWIFDVDSGAEENRIGLAWLRKAWESGTINKVVFSRHDRWMRDQRAAESLCRSAKIHGVKLISATENLPQGHCGVMLRQIIQAFGQYERAVIKERMRLGRHEASTVNGLYTGLYSPYGYDLIDKKLVINESEAAVVRTIFFLESKGYSLTAIGHFLNDSGVPMRHDTARGWEASRIQRTLRMRAAYSGEEIFGRVYKAAAVNVLHEPILPYREPSDRCSPPVKRLSNGSRVPQDFVSGDPIMPRGLRGRPEKANGILLAFHYRELGLTHSEIAITLNDLGETTQLQRKWTRVGVGKYLEKKQMWIAACAAMGVTEAIIPACLGEPAATVPAGEQKHD